MFRTICFSLSRISNFHPPLLLSLKPFNPEPPIFLCLPNSKSQCFHSSLASSSKMSDAPKPKLTIPALDKATKRELLRALESSLDTSFSTNPIRPEAIPLVIVISGPSGVGKDALIKKLREERENLHFVVTATSRPMRPGKVDGNDYFFVSKDEFLSMVRKDELLEYALAYGDYKGIPKKQIRESMARGCDIVLRVDIQGAATIKRILGSGERNEACGEVDR